MCFGPLPQGGGSLLAVLRFPSAHPEFSLA
jgi:hypothetical protein